MDYIELNVEMVDTGPAEILIALLSNLPFESFAEEEPLHKTCMPKDKFLDSKEACNSILT